jgi:ribosomal protein S18 acetylase RimI-like enzyme
MIIKRQNYENSLYEIIKDAVYQPNIEKVKNKIEALLADRSIMYIKIENNKQIGLIIIKELNEIEIELIGVLKKYRNKGIGKELILHVSNLINKPIKLATDETAIGFYRKLGFNVSEVIINYPDGIRKRYECILE